MVSERAKQLLAGLDYPRQLFPQGLPPDIGEAPPMAVTQVLGQLRPDQYGVVFMAGPMQLPYLILAFFALTTRDIPGLPASSRFPVRAMSGAELMRVRTKTLSETDVNRRVAARLSAPILGVINASPFIDGLVETLTTRFFENNYTIVQLNLTTALEQSRAVELVRRVRAECGGAVSSIGLGEQA